MKNVAIHQPNFLPWLGLFHRMSQVDLFVFLDHVQAVRGKSWLSRNKILIGGKPAWVTMPILRSGMGVPRVSDVRIDYGGRNQRKQLRTLEQEYGKHPFGDELLPLLHEVYEAKHVFIADFNRSFIQTMHKRLGLRCDFVSSSSLVEQEPSLDALKGNTLIVEVCKAVGATRYLSGTGCLDFIDPPSFKQEGIDFVFQEFDHPRYRQSGLDDFIPGLSVVDAVCNIGFEGVRERLDAVKPRRERLT